MAATEFQIKTQRLLIRNLSVGDAETLFSYRSHPAITKFQNWSPTSSDDAKTFIIKNEETGLSRPNSWFEVGIEQQASGRLIGDIGLHFLEPGNPQCEIGYTVAPNFQGFGFGTEAVTAAVSFLFLRLKMHRITASVDPQNDASLRLLEKAGFKKEAHFRKSLFFKGQWVDDIVFAILSEDWTVQSGAEL